MFVVELSYVILMMLSTKGDFRALPSKHILIDIIIFLSPGDNEEELVVGWQEKLFSQVAL